jgi:hypothetical protein
MSALEQILIGLASQAPSLAMNFLDYRRTGQANEAAEGRAQTTFEQQQADRTGAGEAAAMQAATMLGNANDLNRSAADAFLSTLPMDVGLPWGVQVPASMLGGADMAKRAPQAVAAAISARGPGFATDLAGRIGSTLESTANAELAIRNDERNQKASKRAETIFVHELELAKQNAIRSKYEAESSRVAARYAEPEARARLANLAESMAASRMARAASATNIASNYISHAIEARQGVLDRREAMGLPLTPEFLGQLDEAYPAAAFSPTEIEGLIARKADGDEKAAADLTTLLRGGANPLARILLNYQLVEDDPIRTADDWMTLLQSRGGDPKAALEAELHAVLLRHEHDYDGYKSVDDMLAMVKQAVNVHDAFLRSQRLPAQQMPVINNVRDLERYLGVDKPSWASKMLASLAGSDADLSDRAEGVDIEGALAAEESQSMMEQLSAMTPQERAAIISGAATAPWKLAGSALAGSQQLTGSAVGAAAQAVGTTGKVLGKAASTLYNVPGVKPKGIPGPGAPATVFGKTKYPNRP